MCKRDLHKVALEEFLQPLLGCRVGQVADVEAAALSRAGGRGIGRLVVNGSVGQSGSDVVDGSVGGLVLLCGRHCWSMRSSDVYCLGGLRWC